MNKEMKKVPTVRFKGFTDDWEQRKLKELVDKYEKSVETPHDGYIRLGVRSHGKGTFHEYVEPGHELETAKMYQVAANKLIFNITFAWEHAVALTDSDDEGKLVSHRFPQFSLHDNLIPDFLKYVILDEKFHHHLYLSSPGGAGRNRVLKINEALDYSIKIPSVLEQKKIGQTLNNITNLITLHQRKLDQLQTLKNYCLQNMFPAKGEKAPAIRLKGFMDDWKQHKLGELLTFRNGFNGNSQQYGSGIPLISVMDILNNNFIFSDLIRSKAALNETEIKRYAVHYGDVLFQRSSETAEDAGTSNVYLDSQNIAVFGGFVICGRKIGDYDPVFLKYLLDSNKIRRQIVIRAQGAQHVNVSQDTLKDISIDLPSMSEQKMIGAHLYNLDNLITLQQRKLDQLQSLKKFMLQNLFI